MGRKEGVRKGERKEEGDEMIKGGEEGRGKEGRKKGRRGRQEDEE